jgi:hypothetical protein
VPGVAVLGIAVLLAAARALRPSVSTTRGQLVDTRW